MLKKRLSEPFEVASYNDPAFDKISHEVMTNYAKTRDLSIIDLDSLEEKPTVFVCNPLRVEYEHLAIKLLSEPAQGAWDIFSTHVIDAKNFDHQGRSLLEFESLSTGNKVLKQKVREYIDITTVNEVVQVICHKALKGDFAPFSLPASFTVDRIHRIQFRALIAKIESAKG